MIYPKMLSILSHAYTLPPHRDDLGVLPYQIQKFSDPSHLVKQTPIATVYSDRHGNIKAVFNVQVNAIVVQILEHAGLNLARSVLIAFQRYTLNGPESNILFGAAWSSQLGTNWGAILQEYGGVASLGILVTLRRSAQSMRNTHSVIHEMSLWFALSGYVALWQSH